MTERRTKIVQTPGGDYHVFLENEKKYSVALSEGFTLDRVGAAVGAMRAGDESDEDFRARIRVCCEWELHMYPPEITTTTKLTREQFRRYMRDKRAP